MILACVLLAFFSSHFSAVEAAGCQQSQGIQAASECRTCTECLASNVPAASGDYPGFGQAYWCYENRISDGYCTESSCAEYNGNDCLSVRYDCDGTVLISERGQSPLVTCTRPPEERDYTVVIVVVVVGGCAIALGVFLLFLWRRKQLKAFHERKDANNMVSPVSVDGAQQELGLVFVEQSTPAFSMTMMQPNGSPNGSGSSNNSNGNGPHIKGISNFQGMDAMSVIQAMEAHAGANGGDIPLSTMMGGMMMPPPPLPAASGAASAPVPTPPNPPPTVPGTVPPPAPGAAPPELAGNKI